MKSMGVLIVGLVIAAVATLSQMVWTMRCPRCSAYLKKSDPRDGWYCGNCGWRG